MNKIGILTGIDANHGSCIFNASLYKLIKNLSPENAVHFVDFLNPRFRLHEFLRSLKVNKEIPFYNLQRSLKNEIPVESLGSLKNDDQLIKELFSKHYSTLIVAKVVWDISNNSLFRFPNIYWLTEKIHTKKIAYAVSGHRTDWETFIQHKKRVFEILSSYQLIGVRDNMTQAMMEAAGVDKVVPVYRISDPAFLYEPKYIEPGILLKRYKISTDQPLLGLLYYSKHNISGKICEHYHRKGYQIINFSMYNPFADINIGHLVTPDEWAALFKLLSFCITDRFHGSVFSMRENIPLVSIEPFPPKTLLNSKIFSVLQDFNIEESCYHNTYSPEFNIDGFLSTCAEVESNWQKEFSKTVRSRLLVQNQNQLAFLGLVKEQIES
jgi:hypothetical protein